MLLTIPVSSILCAILIFGRVGEIVGTIIKSLDVPQLVRNGTGPVELSCKYEIGPHENGLVIKWYHNSDQIYQWIPPMRPRDAGILSGMTYLKKKFRRPNTQSTIKLKVATLEMTGEYVCSISTYQEEAVMKKKMTVYLPENDVEISIADFNRTHLNISCVAKGAVPQPILRFFVEGIEIEGKLQEDFPLYRAEENPIVKSCAIVEKTFEPVLTECEMNFPDTDYKRRERIVYYPTEFSPHSSAAVRIKRNMLCAILTIFFSYIISNKMLHIGQIV